MSKRIRQLIAYERATIHEEIIARQETIARSKKWKKKKLDISFYHLLENAQNEYDTCTLLLDVLTLAGS